ncbi:hypothetical protein EXIGLDRAFT_285525 [Exidia glandulosa HHB12029]|uniref:Telomere length regulation protein conserved domain-containing protein n=1 Tax=Exidia glandulosa HHB12029 TaxID=1314781 RepID=A0A165M4C5_EXIGL|nr:hypothetical protein EXIGLDRAFT_285525 [Exidia glandulosa HHB12029]
MDVRDVVKALSQPVSDVDALLELLIAPLDALHLVPRGLHRPRAGDASLEPAAVARAFPELQRLVILKIAPVWSHDESSNVSVLLEQYFVPVSVPPRAYGECIALLSYSTILANPLSAWSLPVLEKLSRTYSLADLHWAAFSGPLWNSDAKRMLAWEDAIRLVPSVPARVANSRQDLDVPRALQNVPYLSKLCNEVYDLVNGSSLKSEITSISALLVKLVNVGLFSASSNAIGQPSFFSTIMPHIIRRAPSNSTWPRLLASLPAITLQKILASLNISLQVPHDALDCSPLSRAIVKRQATIFASFTGSNNVNLDVVEAIVSTAVDGEWSEGHARILCAVLQLQDDGHNNVLVQLLRRATETWSNAQFIRHSLLQRHRYMTLLLLLAVARFSHKDSELLHLARSSTFMAAIPVYIGHIDPSVRRCGLLVPEEVATRTGRKLKFEGLDEDEWACAIRRLLEASDLDVDVDADEVSSTTVEPAAVEPASDDDELLSKADERVPDSDDDSLVGYDSDDASSRGASPTLEELDEIAKDPSLAVGRPKRPRKPVYLLDLAKMLQETPKPEEAAEHADRIGVALQSAEELIRRKEGYGFELEENAVNLVFALVCLQDTYDSPSFLENRQRALTALVACCPTKAAPAVIEQYFNDQWSIQQRFAILNALTFGARELAGLPVPEKDAALRAAFPSKMLPPAQHAKYTAQESETQRIQTLLGDITRAAIDRAKESNPVPQSIVRERRLRVGKPSAGIVDLGSQGDGARPPTQRHRQPFTALAAEYFVMPIINRFWTSAGDARTRRLRHAERAPAGSAQLLGPLLLSQFLSTMGVLLHAGRHAPAFLAVLAPETLEMGLNVGTQAYISDSNEEEDSGASVLTAALELALVILDTCIELDGGQSLGLERTPLVLGVEEWADEVFKGLERGLKVKGGGGALEARLRGAAAGVGVKISQITERWRRSMLVSVM